MTYAKPNTSRPARAIRETSGPTTLAIGAIGEGQVGKRVGDTFVGADAAVRVADVQLSHAQLTNMVAIRAQAVLTVAIQPTAGDTITIGAQTWTFVANGTANADGQINVGTNLATAKVAIFAALDADDGYNDGIDLFVEIVDFIGDVLTLYGGSGLQYPPSGFNAIPTTSSFASGSNHWGAATFTDGVDASPVEVVPAPGVGFGVLVLDVYAVADLAGGSYTGASGQSLDLVYETGTPIIAADTVVIGTALITPNSPQARLPASAYATPQVPVSNEAVALFNTGSADFGGGDPANTVSVRVWFSVVPTVPFGGS